MIGLSGLIALLLLTSLAQASVWSPFQSVLDSWSHQSVSNETLHHELAKRAVDPTSCPTGYKDCANLGAAGLCCANSAICAADAAGHVACCPSGASCTGSITSVITSGVIAGGGSGASATTTTAASQPLTASVSSSSPTTTSSGGGLVLASGESTTTTATGSGNTAAATTASGFILVGSSTAATLGSNAARNVQTPLIAQYIIRLLEFVAF